MGNEGKKVPGEVAIAVWTGRTQFLTLLRGRLARGEKLPDEQINGLVDLCEEFVTAHFRDLERMNRLKTVIGDMAGLVKAYDTLSRKSFDIVASIEGDLHDTGGLVVYPAAVPRDGGGL